jgi:DNA-binding MarR family transcriptional regulator
MKDFSEEAFQLMNTLSGITEKYSLIEKSPRTFAKGITVFPSQIRAIIAIGHEPGMNVTTLARRLEVTKASASEMVGKLVRNGLVRKTRDVDNNKEVLLHVTTACRVVLQDVDRRHERIFQDIKSILGDLRNDNNDLLLRVLKRIDSALAEFLGSAP